MIKQMEYSNDCGHPQPKYRRTALQITLQWKEALDENQEKK